MLYFFKIDKTVPLTIFALYDELILIVIFPIFHILLLCIQYSIATPLFHLHQAQDDWDHVQFFPVCDSLDTQWPLAVCVPLSEQAGPSIHGGWTGYWRHGAHESYCSSYRYHCCVTYIKAVLEGGQMKLMIEHNIFVSSTRAILMLMR